MKSDKDRQNITQYPMINVACKITALITRQRSREICMMLERFCLAHSWLALETRKKLKKKKKE